MFSSKIQCEVLQAKRFKMEDYAATTLYCVGGKVDEQDSCGTELIKVTGDYELLDTMRGNLPGSFELETELVQGGKDKGALRVLSATPMQQKKTSA